MPRISALLMTVVLGTWGVTANRVMAGETLPPLIDGNDAIKQSLEQERWDRKGR